MRFPLRLGAPSLRCFQDGEAEEADKRAYPEIFKSGRSTPMAGWTRGGEGELLRGSPREKTLFIFRVGSARARGRGGIGLGFLRLGGAGKRTCAFGLEPDRGRLTGTRGPVGKSPLPVSSQPWERVVHLGKRWPGVIKV